MIGETVSHYQIKSKIGEGGMGEVYLAEDTRLGRRVALKFVPDHIRGDQTARERLLREATAASKLNHNNIVSLYDIGEADGRDFIVMEYVEGRSLGEIIKAGDIGLETALNLTRQICRALAAAHDNSVVHRDIKPDNILVTGAGEVKVLDFGLAKVEGAGGLTEDGSTVGTQAYMAPEQIRGEDVDGRADLFSLGVLLYEILTGRLPFQGEHRAAVTYAIMNEEPEPLARYKAGVPGELDRITRKLLHKDRGTRYQTAAGLMSDLECFQRAPGPVMEKRRELVNTYLMMRRYDEADPFLNRLIELAPELPTPYSFKALIQTLQGNLEEARIIAETIPVDTDLREMHLLFVSSLDRKFDESLEHLSRMRAVPESWSHMWYTPISMIDARTCDFMGRKEEAFAKYDSSRIHLEEMVQQHPEDARVHGSLGIVYAELGRVDDALREGGRAVELMPISVDAVRGPARRVELAEIHMIVGDLDRAVDELVFLLEIPASYITIQVLRLDPTWDGLRGFPRFEELIKQ